MEDLLCPDYSPDTEAQVTDTLPQQFLNLEELVDQPTSSTTPRYSCKYCDYTTDKKSNHDSHTKFVHFKARDSCPECGKQIANLNQHLRVSHKIFKSTKTEQLCPICEKPFHNLESHMQKSHNVRNETVHECDVCFKTFAKKDHLVRHENVVHRGVRQTCHLCNKEFSSLDKHMKMKHSHSLQNSTARSVLFPCDNCSETFSKKSELNSHRETSHAIDNPDKFCTICCKQFANLAQHQKIVHNGVKNFKCQNCGKGFYDNRELRRHHIKFLKTRECKKEVSIGVCKYNCDFENCDYKTNKKGNMDMHKDSVHLNIKYDCPECNKKLSSRANLNSHVKNVHDKKIVSGSLQKDPYKLKFLCKLCDYTTNRAMHLDRHMLSVHSAAAFETVEQVYQASQARAHTETPPVQQEVNTARPKIPQFASLVQVEGCSQYLRQDYHQTIPTPVQLIAQRRSTEELIGNCSDLSPFTESSFQLVDNLPSIYYV